MLCLFFCESWEMGLLFGRGIMSEKRRKIRNEFVVSWSQKENRGNLDTFEQGLLNVLCFVLQLK